MATVSDHKSAPLERPELHNGDRMSREEFHRIYEQMPEDFRAELVGGIVYVASPLKRQHGVSHVPLSGLLFLYQASTTGVEAGDNTTILLGEEGEPQPDLYLRILPAYGGQTQTTDDDYILGGPEFLSEIAVSSRALDLHGKKDDYARYGVLEYLVVSMKEQKLWWFDLKNNQELPPDADGVCRIRTFPGLWIHGEALRARDFRRLTETLQQGLASPQHAAFVRFLESRRA